MKTVIGNFSFQLLEDRLDEKTKKFVESNEDIKSACHESAEFLLENNRDYIAITAIAHKNLGGKYFHSFVVAGDHVIDLTANLYMKTDDYYQLYGIEEFKKVTYDQFLKDCEECEMLDESKTMFPLFRNAMYSYFKKGYTK